MSSVDLAALIATLDPDGRGGRRHTDDIAAAIGTQNLDIEASALPEVVHDTIKRGEQEGLWSASRTTTVRRGRTVLPKAVTLLGTARPVDKLLPVDAPLRSELASWAATLRLSAAQRQLLLAVNDWLRRTDGGKVSIVSVAERAYELLRDEKAFDTNPPRGGSTLWTPGRLTFELLRCERLPTPLVWEPVTSEIGQSGAIVCVENHATFRTLLRVLRARTTPPWAAVAWVQGRNTAPLESLSTLPFPVTRLDYLGDLDAAGLQIAATACATAKRADVAAGPAERLWDLLVAQPSRPARPTSEVRARELVAWLPAAVRDRARGLLVAGQAIPQEALRFDVLSDASLAY
ncbi:hypothetical protein [Streptomyces sp. MMS20-AI2-20]|uniref:hypothetical protein n=1 Tax=Streptomyces sp. MMS20-AI2-20 TaxID=2925835 RepID=UPI001F60C1BC|nr:hypothetical protein [Streptomyces sp. MMS20-AI2-20]MCI4142261.1 hypothetical protein [Streptomyces sp. MMS20-AI2-20]